MNEMGRGLVWRLGDTRTQRFFRFTCKSHSSCPMTHKDMLMGNMPGGGLTLCCTLCATVGETPSDRTAALTELTPAAARPLRAPAVT